MRYKAKSHEVDAFQFTGEMIKAFKLFKDNVKKDDWPLWLQKAWRTIEAFKLFKDNVKKDDWPLWLQKAWRTGDFYISEEGNVCISSEMDDGTIFEVFASDWILFYEEEHQFFVCGEDLFRCFLRRLRLRMNKEKKKYILVSGDAVVNSKPQWEIIKKELNREFPEYRLYENPEIRNHHTDFPQIWSDLIENCKSWKWPGFIIITQSIEFIQDCFLQFHPKEEETILFEYRRYESKNISKPKIYTWEDLKVAMEADLEVR